MTHIVLHALDGLEPPVIARVSGDEDAIRAASRDLPEGAATPEAIAVRTRRAGGPLSWGEREPAPDTESRLRFCHARGVASVELVRIDPTLLSDLEIGSYFDRPFTRRLVRRLLLAAQRSPAPSGRAADAAFWSGSGAPPRRVSGGG